MTLTAELTTETITWHTDPADPPDADITEVWRDVHGVEVPVIAWADVPNGTAGVLVVDGETFSHQTPIVDGEARNG